MNSAFANLVNPLRNIYFFWGAPVKRQALNCKNSTLTPFNAPFFFSSPSNVSSYIIYVGQHLLNGINLHQSSHRVSRVVIPWGYVEPQSGKDVALVELSTPIEWSDYVCPVCLPSSGTLFQGGMQCYVTGWGDIREEGKASSHLFRFVQLMSWHVSVQVDHNDVSETCKQTNLHAYNKWEHQALKPREIHQHCLWSLFLFHIGRDCQTLFWR